GVGSCIQRLVQRGDNRIADRVRRRRRRSIVGDRDAAQTSGAGRSGNGLGRSVVGLRQVAACDRRLSPDVQRPGGVGSGVVRIVQQRDNSVAAAGGGRGCGSIVRDRDFAQTGGAGGGGDGLRRSVVGLRQVA